MLYQKYLCLEPDFLSPDEIFFANLGVLDEAAEVSEDPLEPVLVHGGGVVGDPGQASYDFSSHDLGHRGESTGRELEDI